MQWDLAVLHFATHWLALGLCAAIGVRLLVVRANAGHRGQGLAAFFVASIVGSTIRAIAEAYGW